MRPSCVSLSAIAQNSSLLPLNESYPYFKISVAGHTFISATDLRLGSLLFLQLANLKLAHLFSYFTLIFIKYSSLLFLM